MTSRIGMSPEMVGCENKFKFKFKFKSKSKKAIDKKGLEIVAE